MKVYLVPADRTGCGKYRMEYPAAAARAEGVEVEIGEPTVLPVRRRAINGVIVGSRIDADVVVIQRPHVAEIVDAIPVLQREGKAVVVELDDDFLAAQPQSEIFHSWREANGCTHLKRACRLADMVTVSTDTLAAHYGGSKARVLHNLVPSSLLQVTAKRDGRTLGWGGAAWTHVGDLAVTRGGVAQALEATDWRFMQVGPVDGVQRDLRLADEPETTGMVPFPEYHSELARLDVGIAPLADTRFNRSKSALKPLEYAALRIPFVASPLPDYERVHADGIGVLAGDRSREWKRELKRLMLDDGYRAEVADRAWEAVAAHHTYENAGWVWAEAWEDAAALRASSRVRMAA